jgi:hypothetical protein
MNDINRCLYSDQPIHLEYVNFKILLYKSFICFLFLIFFSFDRNLLLGINIT